MKLVLGTAQQLTSLSAGVAIKLTKVWTIKTQISWLDELPAQVCCCLVAALGKLQRRKLLAGKAHISQEQNISIRKKEIISATVAGDLYAHRSSRGSSH